MKLKKLECVKIRKVSRWRRLWLSSGGLRSIFGSGWGEAAPHQLRNSASVRLRNFFGATSSVSARCLRPLKQRLSKSDLAKIGYGTPETAKALRNASKRVAEPCWRKELLSCYELLHIIETHLLRFEAIESVKNRKEKSEPKMNVPAWNHLEIAIGFWRERERESLYPT